MQEKFEQTDVVADSEVTPVTDNKPEQNLTSSSNEHQQPDFTKIRELIICPISLEIFKEPVRLIPRLMNDPDSDGTAVVEREKYDEMISKNCLLCPLTRAPVNGCLRARDIEALVEFYLSVYPEEKQNQYQLTRNLVQNNQLTRVKRAGIEMGAVPPAAQIDRVIGTNIRGGFFHINPTNPNAGLQPYVEQKFSSSEYIVAIPWVFVLAAVGTLVTVTAGSIGAASVHYDMSKMNKVAQANAVGAPVIVTTGLILILMQSLCESPKRWVHLNSRLPIQNPLFYEGDEGLCKSVDGTNNKRILRLPTIVLMFLISGVTGQCLLHGGSDENINLAEIFKASIVGACETFFGSIGVVVLYVLTSVALRRNALETRNDVHDRAEIPTRAPN